MFRFHWIKNLIKISLKIIPMFPIDNKPALFKKMGWRRPGDKSLSEPMMVQFTDEYMRRCLNEWNDILLIIRVPDFTGDDKAKPVSS